MFIYTYSFYRVFSRLKLIPIIEAIKVGKLQYRQNYAHGNPYFRLLRVEVESLAQELHGTQRLEAQEVKFKLQKITKEINSLKKKLASLEKEKIELIEIQKQAQSHDNIDF